MSKKNQKTFVYIDDKNFKEIASFINNIMGFECCMNSKKAQIIITNNKKNIPDKTQLSFEEFKNKYCL